jgi:hypothetical protein
MLAPISGETLGLQGGKAKKFGIGGQSDLAPTRKSLVCDSASLHHLRDQSRRVTNSPAMVDLTRLTATIEITTMRVRGQAQQVAKEQNLSLKVRLTFGQ